ncbi:MAG: leucine-rich repeat domain-containing protein [Promethearchaeota archaeon]
MELSPEKIYQEYSKNNLDKPSATKLLLSLIENSDSNRIRIDSLKQLGHIGIADNNVFKFLENLLISDSSLKVRNTAALILKDLFIDKAFGPMKWALMHEESPLCLETIHITLIEIISNWIEHPNPMIKVLLLKEVKEINKNEFKLGFKILSETRNIDSFTIKELADILINYFTIILFEKIYWRLKYKIKKCRIIELDFIFKNLTTLPLPVRYLTSLKSLILRYNQLSSLPDWIGTLNSLENLNLNVNNLIWLPESIGELKKLKQIFLWKNELKMLPKSIGGLKNLLIIDLRLNQLTYIPETIGKLISLKELNLHDNQLKKLPETIKCLNKLEDLNLSWNYLEDLPKSIGSLSSLKFLDLERNNLVNLPNSIGNLTSLVFLNTSENKLRKIPESIGNLKYLQHLNLSRNKLDSIPESILSLDSLKEIYLGENNFKESSDIINTLKQKGVQIYI